MQSSGTTALKYKKILSVIIIIFTYCRASTASIWVSKLLLLTSSYFIWKIQQLVLDWWIYSTRQYQNLENRWYRKTLRALWLNRIGLCLFSFSLTCLTFSLQMPIGLNFAVSIPALLYLKAPISLCELEECKSEEGPDLKVSALLHWGSLLQSRMWRCAHKYTREDEGEG